MLAQTQVARVLVAWEPFVARFPSPAAMATASPGDVIAAWGRLGYPRRARRLWDTAVLVARDGWPADLTELPGIGRYTAGAVRAEADDDPDAIGIDVNIRRVCERTVGTRLGDVDAASVAVRLARPLRGRERLLALMDLGALVCTPRAPRCADCPLRRRCATRGVGGFETTNRQAGYAGSFRQRRGAVLAALRDLDRCAVGVAVGDLDAEALRSLVEDSLAAITDGYAHLPR